VGVLGGVQPNWHFCSNFILYSNFDMALIWGQSEEKKREKTSYFDSTLSNNWKNAFYRMQAILDLGIGVRWEKNWCCDRYTTALDLGWEHHIWFNHNERTQYEN